jgi:hypothetical protein
VLSVSINAPDRVSAGSTVTLTGVASAGSTLKWTQTAGSRVAMSGANTATASFIAPRGPSSLTFTLTATSAAGESKTVTRTLAVSADSVYLSPVTWVRSQGALAIVATSTALAASATAAPAGMSMTATFWNRYLPAGVRGGPGQPITVPMSFVTDSSVCGSPAPCFVAAPSGVIADPASPAEAPVLLEPTSVVVRSSFGGLATASTPAIQIR